MKTRTLFLKKIIQEIINAKHNNLETIIRAAYDMNKIIWKRLIRHIGKPKKMGNHVKWIKKNTRRAQAQSLIFVYQFVMIWRSLYINI